MTDNQTQGADSTSTDASTTPIDPAPFIPGYTPLAGTRILRSRLYADDGGVATVTFRGQVVGTRPRNLWIEQGTSGRLSLYAEVAVDDDTATEIRVAIIPTGKRVAVAADGSRAVRLGSVKGRHAYLLSVDGSADRVAYDAAQAAARAQREAARLAVAALADADECDGPCCKPDLI